MNKNPDNRTRELIDYFDERAEKGIFDTYTDDDIERINAILDDIHFPRNSAEMVLDCGCGTGRATELLASRLGPESRIVGMDLAPRMIEKARELRSSSEGADIEFRVGNCHEIPFDDETFDWMVVIESFPHFGNLPDFAGEALRILKDGGNLAILDRRPSVATNAFHRKIGGVVANDTMPSTTDFLLTLKEAGFWVMVYVDDGDGFRLMARK